MLALCSMLLHTYYARFSASIICTPLTHTHIHEVCWWILLSYSFSFCGAHANNIAFTPYFSHPFFLTYLSSHVPLVSQTLRFIHLPHCLMYIFVWETVRLTCWWWEKLVFQQWASCIEDKDNHKKEHGTAKLKWIRNWGQNKCLSCCLME